MVLKRKLPTQKKQEKKQVEKDGNQLDQFDMSIDTDSDKSVKAAEGFDVASDEVIEEDSERVEDMIPEELKAKEEASQETPEEIDSKQKQEDDRLSNAFDEANLDEDFNKYSLESDDMPTSFLAKEVEEDEKASGKKGKKKVSESATVPSEEPVPYHEDFLASADEISKESETKDSDVFNVSEDLDQAQADFEHKDSFEDFEKIEEPVAPVVEEPVGDELAPVMQEDDWKKEIEESQMAFDSKNKEFDVKDSFADDDFIVPEIMGNKKESLHMNNDGSKKLIIGIIIIAIIAVALFILPKEDKDKSERWSESEQTEKALSSDDIFAAPEESAAKGETKSEESDVTEISFEDLEKEESLADTASGDAETEINLLEPEVVETTASGKELIKADEDVEIPEELLSEEEKGANLIDTISEEIKRQQAKRGMIVEEEETSEVPGDEGNPADINKRVDDQLAEYRKLLAEEEDPGKKLKPAQFFSGKHKGIEQSGMAPSAKVERISLEEGSMPEGYIKSEATVAGHQIIEYPREVPREPDPGIRTLDHFRSLIAEKKDERVRMPRNVRPALRNQGFPTLRVVSIVPNYGLIAEFNGKQGVLMIGESLQGWELIGVYRSYAEFKMGNRKHIISLN